jgi:hypothetical protein
MWQREHMSGSSLHPGMWQREHVSVLDSPAAGRYTQSRLAPDGSLTFAWNSVAAAGLRIARCLDARCAGGPSTARTVTGADEDPRFLRMELLPQTHGAQTLEHAHGAPSHQSAPLFIYSARSETQLRLTRCADAACTRASHVRLVGAERVRHSEMVLVRAAEMFELRIVVSLSNHTRGRGSSLVLLHISLANGTARVAAHGEVARSDLPFMVDSRSKLPTGGLENPALVVTAGGQAHVAFWDVSRRELALIWDAGGPTRTCTVVAAGADGSIGSSPGGWVRVALDQAEEALTVFYFDLPLGVLWVQRCEVHSRTCPLRSQILDRVGQRDVSDFGAGAFPHLLVDPSWGGVARGGVAGDGVARDGAARDGAAKDWVASGERLMLAYFDEATGSGTNRGGGQLKLLECTAGAARGALDTRRRRGEVAAWTAPCAGSVRVHVLAQGLPGFGRDPSIALVRQHTVGGGGNETLFAAFLDLGNASSSAELKVAARLALFSRMRSSDLVGEALA